jgi:hypothetical protein
MVPNLQVTLVENARGCTGGDYAEKPNRGFHTRYGEQVPAIWVCRKSPDLNLLSSYLGGGLWN